MLNSEFRENCMVINRWGKGAKDGEGRDKEKKQNDVTKT